MALRSSIPGAVLSLATGGILLWLCLSLGSCYSAIRPTDQVIARALSVDPVKSDPSQDLPTLANLSVLIDTSGSMAGYVRTPNSQYLEVLDKLLSRGSSQVADFRVAKFEEPKNLEIKGLSTDWAYYLKSYGGGTTELAAGFESIAALPEEMSAVIVLSDLVSSSKFEAQTKVAAAAAAAAEKFPAYILAAFRSGYDGRYVPMAHPRTAGFFPVKVGNHDGDRRRPFYLILFARTEPILKLTYDSLVATLGPEEELDYTALPVIFDVGQKIRLSREDEVNLSVFEQPRPLGLTASLQRIQIVSLTAKRKNMGRSQVEIPVRLSRAADSRKNLAIPELEKLSTIRKAVEVSPNGTTRPFDLSEVEFKLKAGGTVDGFAEIKLTSRFPKVTRGNWLAIKHTLAANSQSLVLPEWVSQWSTRNDRALVDSNRTLGLDTLALSLANGSPSRRVLMEYVVLFGEE